MFGTIASGVKEPSAVVVSEAVGWAGLSERSNHLQHLSKDEIEFGGDLDAIQRCEQAGIQEKVEGVDVVIQRLLKIYAVRTHLPDGFLLNDSPAALSPLFGSRDLGIQRSNQENCYGCS